jgi:hypothetical protein
MQRELLHRGIESRVMSMVDERPLEVLVTHTSEELRQALAHVQEPVPPGYAEAFLAVQEKWKHSLNCWSASPSIQGRVLSNWYPIEEGIRLYGATYDSTEHFWQSVKYHPDITVANLTELLAFLEQQDWSGWLGTLADDPKIYLPNAYAVEFLRHNLSARRLRWFREELSRHGLRANDLVRLIQQRSDTPFRFSAYEEKILWGDLADLFHLIYTFSPTDNFVRKMLIEYHFDAIYLGEHRMAFISKEFRSLMLEIWKVKYLQIPRFREVIRSIPLEIRLEHFLNDGDSPDIPIPVYVEYLNEIRNLARKPLNSERSETTPGAESLPPTTGEPMTVKPIDAPDVPCSVIGWGNTSPKPSLTLLCPPKDLFAPLHVYIKLSWLTTEDVPDYFRDISLLPNEVTKLHTNKAATLIWLNVYDRNKHQRVARWVSFNGVVDVALLTVVPSKYH